jgi:hypothetical protein
MVRVSLMMGIVAEDYSGEWIGGDFGWSSKR